MQNTEENEVGCTTKESSQSAVQALRTTSGPKARHLLMREDNSSAHVRN